MVTEPTPAGHHEYRLTEKGRDIVPVIVALTEWGDRWQAPEGPPIEYVHDACGGPVRSALLCHECRVEVPAEEVVARPTEIMQRALERRRGG